MKPGFSKVDGKQGKTQYVCEEDLKNKEVWLIKSPFDVSYGTVNDTDHIDLS